MGLYLFSRSTYDDKPTIQHFETEVYTDLEFPNTYLLNEDKRKAVTNPNPDPSKFNIITWVPVDKYLVVCIEYPNCENYEGKKVLVYEDLTIEQLRRFNTIDPHFSESTKFKSPIARFIPTTTGMDMAVKFCLAMIN
jgi:hypothetical protein